MLYTSPGYWAEYGSTDSYWRQFPLWLAHYGVTLPTIPKPWLAYTFWQYTDSGDGLRFGAESKELDMDVFAGDEAALKAFANGQTPPQPTLPRLIKTATACNVRNAPRIATTTDVGDLATGKTLSVAGDAGEFWEVKLYVGKSVSAVVE